MKGAYHGPGMLDNGDLIAFQVLMKYKMTDRTPRNKVAVWTGCARIVSASLSILTVASCERVRALISFKDGVSCLSQPKSNLETALAPSPQH